MKSCSTVDRVDKKQKKHMHRGIHEIFTNERAGINGIYSICTPHSDE